VAILLQLSLFFKLNNDCRQEQSTLTIVGKMSEFDFFNLSDKDRQGAARVQA
jgi:hypothetical protein